MFYIFFVNTDCSSAPGFDQAINSIAFYTFIHVFLLNADATSCPLVPMFAHAIPSTTATDVATPVTYTCEVGYRHDAVNQPYKQCLPTGIWDGLSPNCLRK